LSLAEWSRSVSVPAAVVWQPWAADTFERARLERRPIYVNVAAGWCHWCHVMDERTFADPKVARELSERFVAIRVDADARPDLAERYAEWGWPANAILTPDAQPVTERRGYQEPGVFLELLQGVSREAAAGSLKPRPTPAPPKPAQEDLVALRDLVQRHLDGYYDARIAGWGHSQKYPFAAPVEHCFLRAARGEDGWLDAALQTLDNTRKLIDPVWGGVWQYSVDDSWDEPHYEKIAVIQAGALDNWAQAYASTGRFRKAAVTVRDYLATFLTNPDGAFATSQDADVVVEGRPTVLGSEYCTWPAERRRRHGLPRTDRNAYADWNGLLIAALCRLHDAAGDKEALAMAKTAARALRRTHRTEEGAYTHAADDDTGLLHLRDNAAMGRALLALHQSTGDATYLEATLPVARFLLTLEHPDGGFRAHTPDPNAAGALAQPRRPLEENGLAMRFLVELSWRLPDDDPMCGTIRAAAERAARALAHPELVEGEGRIVGTFLLGLEHLLLRPVHLDVAGPPRTPETRALWEAALALDLPGKVVRWSPPEAGRPKHPAIYVCQGDACSAPVTQPDDLPAAVRRLA
jgi:uncharacterized protein